MNDGQHKRKLGTGIMNRRNAIKTIAAGAAGVALVPFVEPASFASSSASLLISMPGHAFKAGDVISIGYGGWTGKNARYFTVTEVVTSGTFEAEARE